MAYLRDIGQQCEASGCTKRAAVELFDYRNESRGRYCRACGGVRKRSREDFEKRNPRRD